MATTPLEHHTKIASTPLELHTKVGTTTTTATTTTTTTTATATTMPGHQREAKLNKFQRQLCLEA